MPDEKPSGVLTRVKRADQGQLPEDGRRVSVAEAVLYSIADHKSLDATYTLF